MSTLHVALQEGFQGDTVIVRLGGAEVYRRAGVKTRMQIGLADSFELDAPPPGPAELQVEVPSRNTTATVPLEVPDSGELYVGVSVAPDGRIDCRSGEEPFRYA
jgi:hypothetical protein